jgi:hypothetical protein
MGNNQASVSFALFNNLIEIYYRGAAQEYPVVIDTEYLTLNRYYQNIAGARFNIAFASGGIEFDHYRSSLIPYKRINYYLNLNHSFSQKLLISVNASIRDYTLIDTETDHLYANVAARAKYIISPKSRINLEFSYLNQTGKGIDLDLMTMRSEFITSYRKLFFKLGVRSYSRKYLTSRFMFYGTYIELARKF